MDVSDETGSRIEAMEIKLSYQESMVQELSATLYEQAQRLERMERLVKEMSGKMKDLVQESLPGLPPNERPPHY